MGCESFDVVRFDLGPLLQGQTTLAKLKSTYNLLIINSRGFAISNQPTGNHVL